MNDLHRPNNVFNMFGALLSGFVKMFTLVKQVD